MLRHERWESSANAVESAISGRQSQLWTAIPGIVQSYNAKDNTVEVQPAIQSKQSLPSGEIKDLTMPLCVDVPVHFPSAGGYALSFPVKKGDECLLVFSARCIDGWWKKGGVQPQAMIRLHDLSDGFAILGTRSQKNALKEPSTKSVQLRTEDGKSFFELKGKDVHVTSEGDLTVTVKGKVTIKVTGDAHIDAATVVLNSGSQRVARIGDTVVCPAGTGRITTGAPKVLA